MTLAHLKLKSVLTTTTLFSVALLSMLLRMSVASAQGQGTGSAGNGSGTGQGGSIDVNIQNPLGNETTIYDIANALLGILMVFAVPIILFFIVWAGFLYVTAGGDQAQITKATKALMYAIIGGVIVLGAQVLLAVITNTVNVMGT